MESVTGGFQRPNCRGRSATYNQTFPIFKRVNQIRLFESMQMVTGPSLTHSHSYSMIVMVIICFSA